jgi:hypothetical protein
MLTGPPPKFHGTRDILLMSYRVPLFEGAALSVEACAGADVTSFNSRRSRANSRKVRFTCS